jgi:RND family efflux transporter MFP subunit
MSNFWIAFLLILSLGLSGCGSKEASAKGAADAKKAPDPIAVRTATAEGRHVERSIAVTGSLLPDESVTVVAEVPGRIAALNVDFGTFVKKGDVIAELDKQELSLQLERSRAALAQALARIGLEASQEDAKVEQTPLMRQAWNQMEDARVKYENAKKLASSGDIAQERFNELEKAFRVREAAFEATKDDLRTQMAVIRSLKADVKLAEKRLRDATVVAPFDGSISQKLVSPGQYIRDNTGIVTLVKSSPLRLRAEVPEPAVGQVKIGTLLSFITDAAPGKEFHAVVRELNPSVDDKSRTLMAEARLVGADARLRPGMFVQVRIITERDYAVVAVPRAAVFTIAGLYKVFVIENGKAVEHKLDDVQGKDGWVELPEGQIKSGAQVAISNLPLLSNGAPVTSAGGKS